MPMQMWVVDSTTDQWRPLTTDDLAGGGGGGGAVTIADGADVAQGDVNDAAVVAGAEGTLSAKLRSISRDLVANVGLANAGYRAQVTVTRPANQTPYNAGDVVGGVIEFPTIGPQAQHVMLTSFDLRYDVSAIPSGMTTFRLHLYSATPPSALADNAPWDLPSGDRASYIGYIDIGALTDFGSTLFAQVDGLAKQVKLATGATSLWGYLVTAGAYTPAANSEVLVPTLRTVSC